MSVWCKHNWKVIEKTYVDPKAVQSFKLDVCGEGIEFIQRAILGVTTVLVQCTKCTKLKKIEMFGKEK